MKRFITICALVLAVPLAGDAQEPKTGGQQQQQPPQAVAPDADKVLKEMGAAMAAAKRISFEAHAIADQLTPDGQKVQYAKNQKVRMQRPDRLAVDVTGDAEELQFRYDGKRVTLYNPKTQSWGATDAPASIDETLDMLAVKYGMPMPLADLVFADPYKVLTENVRSGEHLGTGYVFDVKCHHLAFRQAAVDWQIWVEEGANPLPRKVVITFKESPGHPQYTAFLSNWNLSADTPASAFAFTPPAGARQVEFAPPPAPPSAPQQPAAGGGKP
jgi:hypothetical protein